MKQLGVAIIAALLAQATGSRSGKQTIGTDLSTFTVTPSGSSTAQSIAAATRDPFCNVRKPPFNANANGTDDAPEINAAILACDHVYIPAGVYNIGSTLLLDDRTGVTIEGAGVKGVNTGLGAVDGNGTLLYWTGNSTDPMVKVFGSAHTRIQSLKILAQAPGGGGTTLDTGIRYETKSGKVNTANKVRDVTITSTAGATLHYGVRFVAGTGGDANNDQSSFDNLILSGYDTAGVDISHAQSVDHRFFNLITGSTNGATTYGITAATGATFSVYGGGGGGHTGSDFNVLGSFFSPITIQDFHSENSAHFLITAGGVPTNSGGPVTIIGCSATDGAVAANGRVIDFEAPGPLTLINFVSNSSTAKNKSIYYDATALNSYNFTVLGLFFTTSASTAFPNFQPTFMTGVEVVNAGGVIATKAKAVNSTVTLTYSANIAVDAGLGNDFRIDVANATPFTIQFPTNGVKGQRITFRIRNVSGGAMGAITWTSYRMTAFTNPANATTRAIEFLFDGFNYYEMNRAAADVPN